MHVSKDCFPRAEKGVCVCVWATVHRNWKYVRVHGDIHNNGLCNYVHCQKREAEVVHFNFKHLVGSLYSSCPGDRIHKHIMICLWLRAASLSPSVSYGRLEQSTELVVSPKTRRGNLSAPMRTSKEPHFHRKQSLDHSPASQPSLGSRAPVPQSHQWGGIADLKSLFHHIIMGAPVKELPTVPNIPALFTDSIYRVCGAPPGSLCTMSHVATAVIHLFPLSHGLKVGLTGGQSSVTYGLLSKVLSPKETRDRAKQTVEKKKNAAAPEAAAAAAVDEGDKPKDEKTMVVKVVCHDAENLAGKGRCRSKGDIHSGKVWVSEPLSRRTAGSFIHHKSCASYYLYKRSLSDPATPGPQVECPPTFNSQD